MFERTSANLSKWTASPDYSIGVAAAAAQFGWRPGQDIEIPLSGRNHRFIVAGVWRDYARQFGAIAMAGLGVGLWPSTEALKTAWKEDRSFTPSPATPQRNELRRAWDRAIAIA